MIYSESLQSQAFHGMFKDVQCEHRQSHGTHQADSPILTKRVSALRLAQPYHAKLRDARFLSYAETPILQEFTMSSQY